MLEFLQQNWLLIAGLILVATYLFKGPLALRLYGIGSVSPTSAVSLINRQGARVVDVREDSEWQQGHIPEAIHMPLGKLGDRMEELEPYKVGDAPLVVTCRSGNRSAMAAVRLRKAGFAAVYNLEGGTLAWQQAGMPFET
ncbi:rhodanese-like domain-containing protein [Thiohalorhabdus sp.]|uniref:rhodanese-like domain-containing protein n=1 Tax=Thiohalorhabdus sp. TaxID=3094134 RepID=UPI002FC341CE